MKKYKRIYVNGASDVAGGGLYVTSTKEYYKEKFGIKYSNEKDATFGKFLADSLGMEYHNDALCGSGTPRLIRTTFDYIRQIGINEAQKTIFILQIHNPISRLEFYSTDINDYIVTNVGYYPNGKLEWLESSNDYANPIKDIQFFENISRELKPTIVKFHNPMLYEQKIKMELVGLFAFFKLYNIEFFVENSYNYYWCSDKDFDSIFFNNDWFKDRIIEIEGYSGVTAWCTANKKMLFDDTDGVSMDNHPSLFGHKAYAELFEKFLKEKLEHSEN